MSFFGKIFVAPKENLYDIIKGMEVRYVVDTHVQWETLSVHPQHQNKAFILGTTITKERDRPLSFFENHKGERKVRENVFIFGMRNATPEDVAIGWIKPTLWINRLDENCFDAWNREEMTKNERTKIWDDSKSVNEEKQTVLELVGVEKINDVEQFGRQERESKKAELVNKICAELPKCPKDFIMSIQVSRYVYAILLIFKEAARNNFSKPAYRHVLGDMQLIQNALFWDAAILSEDWQVRYMAPLCKLKCLKTL
jgi:hypothetical protein